MGNGKGTPRRERVETVSSVKNKRAAKSPGPSKRAKGAQQKPESAPKPRGGRIRVALADDHPLVRAGIRSSLAGFSGIEIVGEASNGEEAVALIRKERPDVALLDISMPEMDGLAALKTIRKEAPETKVLILSMHDGRAYITAFLKAGARGYMLKDSAAEEVVRAIETVHRGDAFFSPRVSRVLLQDYAEATEKPARRKENLSSREREVLMLIAEGLSNKEIAGRLFLSVRTVETHREHLMDKLGIHSAAGLTRYAVAHGFVESDQTPEARK